MNTSRSYPWKTARAASIAIAASIALAVFGWLYHGKYRFKPNDVDSVAREKREHFTNRTRSSLRSSVHGSAASRSTASSGKHGVPSLMHPESGRLLASPLPDGLFLEEAAYTKIVEESGIENTANYLLQFPDFRDHTNLARLHFALMDIVAGEDLDQMLMLMRKFGRTNEHGSITICFTEIVKRNQWDSFSSLKEFMDLGAGSYTAISAEPFFSELLASGLSYKEILERTMRITGSREIPDYLASNYFAIEKRPLQIDSEDWEFVVNYLQTADIIGIDEYLKTFFGRYD